VKSVTYRGPDDWFRIDEHDVTLTRDVPQQVPQEVSDFVAGYEGHQFDEGEPAAPKATPAAEKLAEEEGVALDDVKATGSNGDITIDDVKAAVEAANPPN
jgi:pyruvate/2-oxoglutarate dehydrogenase complex dihydrolipoamide acyltransferase (E2) component